MSPSRCWLPMVDCECATCAGEERVDPPRAWLVGPFRKREPRWRVAIEVACALLVLVGLGAAYGAIVGALP